jgi:hypothetical protein
MSRSVNCLHRPGMNSTLLRTLLVISAKSEQVLGVLRTLGGKPQQQWYWMNWLLLNGCLFFSRNCWGFPPKVTKTLKIRASLTQFSNWLWKRI